MEKRVLSYLFCLFLSCLCGTQLWAQQGIGTKKPNKSAAFEIESDTRGLLIPRVSLTNLSTFSPIFGDASLANSLLVFNKTTDTNENLSPGYYYWSTANGGKWHRLLMESDKAMPKFFYMPSILIPTDASQVTSPATFGTIDLHEEYVDQFGSPMMQNPDTSTSLPVYAVNELDYYITWYDTAVFTNVQISNSGVLTYDIVSGANVSLGSFMNIVLVVK